MRDSNVSQEKEFYGFETIHQTNSVDVLLLKSSDKHLFKNVPSHLKSELTDFFDKFKEIGKDKSIDWCDLNKAKNFLLGRWVGTQILVNQFSQSNSQQSNLQSLKSGDFCIRNATEEFRFGKPLVFIQNCETSYCISISHSDYLGLAGFSLNQNIGVDMELVKPRTETFKNLVLTASEIKILEKQINRQDEILTAFWVSKEAISKVIGKGLKVPLKNFNVVLDIENLYNKPSRGILLDSNLSETCYSIRIFQKKHLGRLYILALAEPLG